MRSSLVLSVLFVVLGCAASTGTRVPKDAAVSVPTPSDVTPSTEPADGVPPFLPIDTGIVPDPGPPLPDTFVCAPAAGYYEGQAFQCKDFKKPCVLFWHSTSCTWSCGVPPNGIPTFLSEIPADPTSAFADPEIDCKLVTK